jgi:thymidine phosphorylase
MSSDEEAIKLAQSMVDTSTGLGVKTVAQVTRMSDPIGRMVGNSLEVIESVEVMQGRGPDDTVELVTLQGGQLLLMAGVADDFQTGVALIQQSLQDGSALARFRSMCIAQGVKESIAGQLCVEPRAVLPMASEISEIGAGKSGFITEISARQCAEVAGDLGAGRKDIDDEIKPSVGLQFHLVVGDEIIRDQTWLSVHHEGPLKSEHLDKLCAAIEIGSAAKEPVQRLICMLE